VYSRGTVRKRRKLQNPDRYTYVSGERVRDFSIRGKILGTGNCDFRLTNQSSNIEIPKGAK
jgi:hypothetical protein